MLSADRSKAFKCVRLGLADVKEKRGQVEALSY
jgi:hypothetical protein